FPARDKGDVLRLGPSSDPRRVEAIRYLFTCYAEEPISLRQLARRMNQLGFPVVYGDGWYVAKIRGMLANPAYVGRPAWNKRWNQGGAGGLGRWAGGGARGGPPARRRGRVHPPARAAGRRPARRAGLRSARSPGPVSARPGQVGGRQGAQARAPEP